MTSAPETHGRRSLASERHDEIVRLVRRAGAARVVELATQLNVSEMTIRRDLDVLDEAGVLAKVHGGATARLERSTDEPGFQKKSQLYTKEKHAIARGASTLVTEGTADLLAEGTAGLLAEGTADLLAEGTAGLLAEGSSIGITGGTTTAALAEQLRSVAGITIVTNSIRVADIFSQDRRVDQTVILTGGQRTLSDALVGPVAVNSLRSFHLDMVFMGVHGMHKRAGFTTPNLAEAETNRAFAAATDQLIVLADYTKWGITGLATMADLADASILVTDDGHDIAVLDELERNIPRVVVCPVAANTEMQFRRSADTTQSNQEPA